MTIPDRYDAFWIPGPDDFDMDEGLRRGYEWLDHAAYPGEKVVVLYAKKMVSNRRTLARAGRYHVVSPRGQDIPYTDAGPVLAIWRSGLRPRRSSSRSSSQTGLRCASSRTGTTSPGGSLEPVQPTSWSRTRRRQPWPH